MKKGFKKGFFLVVFLAAAGFVFYRGWLQFAVSTDECGVMVSKTSGVCSSVIERGVFLWRWEPLIPTNVKILRFSRLSKNQTQTVEGSLPSADVYSLQIQQNPDFSYRFQIDLSLQVASEKLVDFVSQGRINSQADVDSYLDQCSDRLASEIASFVIDEAQKNPAFLASSLSTEDIVRGVNAQSLFPDLEIRSIFIKDAKIPDLALYERAKKTFEGFQTLVDKELASLARRHAESILNDNRAVNKLTKIGEALKKYPEVSEILKNADAAAILKSMDTLN